MKASAPGKIILFGEHAVVYNRPALAVPVNQVQVEVEVSDSSQPGIWIHAPIIDLHAELSTLPTDHPIGSVILRACQLCEISPLPNISLTIDSTIPVASGLGSGAAVSVAIIRALSAFCSHPLNNEQINGIVYETEKLHHGTPSGSENLDGWAIRVSGSSDPATRDQRTRSAQSGSHTERVGTRASSDA